MGKLRSALVGAAVGTLAALAYVYLFGPAEETTHDETYQSRLDFALREGERAAADKEAELRGEFQRLRSRPAA